MKRLAILGAGGHGKVIADAAECSGWVVTFFDDMLTRGQLVHDWAVTGDTARLRSRLEAYDGVIVGIGNNKIRLEITQMIAGEGARLATIIHPGAQVSRRASIGEGSVVFAGAIVNVGSAIGHAVIINTAATVDHDCVLADGVHVSPGAHLAGGVTIGDRSWVGIGSAIKEGVKIGRDAVVGAGASVIHDVADGETVVGSPAKPVRERVE